MSTNVTPRKPITAENPYKICFVCLGNICRSPTAEGVFQHLVNEENLQSFFYIDSAGTSAWHIGERANSKSRQVASSKGVELLSRARLFEADDLDEFDLIVAMDEENYQNLIELADDNQLERIKKMREFDPQPGDGNVPDPYYGGLDGFEKVYQIIYRSSRQLLDTLKTRIES